ncbi:hypothetical protein M5D96_008328 [Drosophila gunungcola]|uniref:DNA topoisomerase (ATP-hydrolyzing) n=1 Tax=Drosophila gunungcola TaxID=103775 RepID=A0A9P9YKL3_9MUSC|nr:hypothetical protein M5D96_008328 [Drosophila gunungcola]
MGELVENLERIALELVANLAHGNATLRVPRNSSPNMTTAYRRVTYNSRGSRHSFCLLVYMLSRVHRLQVRGGSFTVRGLYYGDSMLIRSQSRIAEARLDVCRMLNTSPLSLGILAASKGLMSGDVRLLMTNGDVMDSSLYCGPMTLPTDPEKVDRIETQADFVLVVEKESVFESLLSRNVFSTIDGRFILITGKGYPDCCTRRMTMSFSSQELDTPSLRWIGLHPSEIPALGTGAVALGTGDNKKINDLLARNDLEPGVRQELRMLQDVQLKAEIENVKEFHGW